MKEFNFEFKDLIKENEGRIKLLDNISFKELHRLVIKEYLRRLK
jgi:hypothetical protein